MICPRCQQGVQELNEGLCPYCGYPCAQFHRRVTTVQVIIGAIFASTLVYGAVVAVMEMVVDYTPPAADLPEHLLGGVLLGSAIIPVLVLWKLGGALLSDGGLEGMQRGFVLMAAGSELPAVFGLVAYLLVGSLMWFVILLALSWAMFLRLGMSLPGYLNTMKDEIGRGGRDMPLP